MNSLRARREELGLTQPQVSERLREIEPRIDVSMVSRYENGVALPTKAQLEGLEDAYGVKRTELYDMADLDLLGFLESGEERPAARRPDTAPSHAGSVRKCYRISKAFAAAMPADLLAVCNYSSWQSWHDAAIRRLLAEYAARKKAMRDKIGVQQSESDFERKDSGVSALPGR